VSAAHSDSLQYCQLAKGLAAKLVEKMSGGEKSAAKI